MAMKRKRGPKGYFVAPRSTRGVERVHLHILIRPDIRDKLVRLTHSMEMSASDVVRQLIDEAPL